MAKENKGFYDTNVLIAYLFKEENRFNTARKVLEKHTNRAFSIISLHEIHMYSVKFGVEDKFLKIKSALHRLFKVEPLNQEICIKATYLRRKYKLPEVDALILATAIHFKYSHFYTFDKDFKKLNNIKINSTLIHYLG